MRDEVQAQGKRVVLVNPLSSAHLVNHWYEQDRNPFEDATEDAAKLMEKSGLFVKRQGSVDRIKLFRKEDDELSGLTVKDELSVFKADFATIVCQHPKSDHSAHWIAKFLESEFDKSGEEWNLIVTTIDYSVEVKEEPRPNDRYDKTLEKIYPHLVTPNGHDVSTIYFRKCLPGKYRNESDSCVGLNSDGMSCGIAAIMNLAQALLGIEKRYGREDMLAVRYNLFYVFTHLDQYRRDFVDISLEDVDVDLGLRQKDVDTLNKRTANLYVEEDVGVDKLTALQQEDVDTYSKLTALPISNVNLYDDDEDIKLQTRMPAISCRAPWAHLIIEGKKRVENRSWDLPRDFEGKWIALHASRQVAKEHLHGCDLTQFTLGHILGKYFVGKTLFQKM